MLPRSARIREPELLYNTSEHGYNLTTMYSLLRPYRNAYKFVFIIIKTGDNDVFGAFIDMVIQHENGYQGGDDCFVFQLNRNKKWVQAEENI